MEYILYKGKKLYVYILILNKIKLFMYIIHICIICSHSSIYLLDNNSNKYTEN